MQRAHCARSIAARCRLCGPRGAGALFEVASIKPNKSGSGTIGIRFPGVGQFNVINMPLREMIRFAYRCSCMQIEGGPDWITSDRFDIVAKAEGRPTMSQVNAMLRIAAGRALRASRSIRKRASCRSTNWSSRAPTSGSARNCSRQPRNAGPCACRTGRRNLRRRRPAVPGRRPFRQATTGSDLRCGALFGPGFITLRQFTMDALRARPLTMVARRWSSTAPASRAATTSTSSSRRSSGQRRRQARRISRRRTSDGPSMFTAIQEQLGLKLESARGPGGGPGRRSRRAAGCRTSGLRCRSAFVDVGRPLDPPRLDRALVAGGGPFSSSSGWRGRRPHKASRTAARSSSGSCRFLARRSRRRATARKSWRRQTPTAPIASPIWPKASGRSRRDARASRRSRASSSLPSSGSRRFRDDAAALRRDRPDRGPRAARREAPRPGGEFQRRRSTPRGRRRRERRAAGCRRRRIRSATAR